MHVCVRLLQDMIKVELVSCSFVTASCFTLMPAAVQTAEAKTT